MWLHNPNLDNDLTGSQDSSFGYCLVPFFEQHPKIVDYYHIRDPDSDTFVCYDLRKTIQNIVQTYTIDERVFKPVSQNLINLNLIRTTNIPISSLVFQQMHGEKTSISKEAFFKQYGVKYRRS